MTALLQLRASLSLERDRCLKNMERIAASGRNYIMHDWFQRHIAVTTKIGRIDEMILKGAK